jgi:hypothetical protein
MVNDLRLTMVPFLLVDNSQDSINYMIKIIYSGYTLSRQIIINFIKERKTMALQSFSRFIENISSCL